MSFCVPIMNRVFDLRKTLRHSVRAAAESMPVVVSILDYNSSDGLGIFIRNFNGTVAYTRYEGREYYHMAHAYNLAVKCSSGEFVVVMGADAVLTAGYVSILRQLIADGCIWMRPRHYRGIICIQRKEFLAAGGYDERFNLYMGEDKELEARLRRRGAKFGLVPDGLVGVIRTSARDKLANYGSSLSKREMMTLGASLRKENETAGLLVANAGKEWGAW